MRRFAILAAALVGVLVVPAAAWASSTQATAASSTPATTGCGEAGWPATVQGVPAAFHAGGPAGFYVWHDSLGWHLRTTTPAGVARAFSGKIVVSDRIARAAGVTLERGDTYAVSGNTITFRFTTSGHVDGLNFTVGCSRRLSMGLRNGSSLEAPSRIWLGRYGHPATNPFTMTR